MGRLVGKQFVQPVVMQQRMHQPQQKPRPDGLAVRQPHDVPEQCAERRDLHRRLERRVSVAQQVTDVLERQLQQLERVGRLVGKQLIQPVVMQ